MADKTPNVLCEQLTDTFLQGANTPGRDRDTVCGGFRVSKGFHAKFSVEKDVVNLRALTNADD